MNPMSCYSKSQYALSVGQAFGNSMIFTTDFYFKEALRKIENGQTLDALDVFSDSNSFTSLEKFFREKMSSKTPYSVEELAKDILDGYFAIGSDNRINGSMAAKFLLDKIPLSIDELENEYGRISEEEYPIPETVTKLLIFETLRTLKKNGLIFSPTFSDDVDGKRKSLMSAISLFMNLKNEEEEMAKIHNKN